jgi:hypothetical protein
MKLLLSAFIFLACSTAASAQKLYGTIFNTQGDLLPYSSVTIKGTTKGTSANDKGKYSLAVAPGKYTVVCRRIGYALAEKEVTVDNNDTELSFILNEQKLTLETVVVNNKGEDPAYEVIRNAIKKRNYYSKQVDAFTVNIYGKDMIRMRNMPKRIFGQKIPDADRKEMGLDSAGQGIIYLSESISKVSSQKPDKFKLEVMSSRVSGSGGFGFNFPAFISLYSNNVTVFTEKFNPRGFVSPIADGAIGFYKFKMLGTFMENGKMVNSIRVTPRRKYEPLFSGTINITEDDWRIHSFDLTLTKSSQLEILDTLQITQQHVPVTGEIWRVKNQLLHFGFNQLGIDAAGNFLTVYSDYDLKPKFPKKFFDNVIIKYDTAVNKKTTAYWDSARAVPLEKEEQMDYKVKDSAYKTNRDSLLSKRSLDSINKHQPKIKPTDIVMNGIRRNHFTKTSVYNYGIEPLFWNAEYNPAEGAVVQLKGYVSKYMRKSKTGVSFAPTVRYGFSNTHLNAYGTFTIFSRATDSSSNKLKRYSLSFSGGKRVSDFNKERPFSAFNNSISTLLFGRNYMKTYENYYGSVTFNKRYESGLNLTLNALYEDRTPLDNTTDFVVFDKYKSRITPNYPYEKISAQFTPHQAVLAGITLRYKPGQKYIQFPNYKMAVGSKYPEFTLNYTKGISDVFGSDVNFDKWKFTVSDDKNLKLAGTIKYKFGIGGFLNDKSVFIQDYQHFNGNRAVAAAEYVNSFQLAPYYQYSTTAGFYAIGHLEHHFNGLLTNKIPLFRKLNWNLVAGSNAFYVNNKNNYVEIFGGLENILKIFRVDFVAGYLPNGKVNTGVRIGGGGLLGGSIKKGGDGGVNISL